MNFVMGARGQMGAVMAQGRGGASNGLLTGLVAYWALDEASGNALDKHSGGLTLTQVGTVGSGAGQVYAAARGSYAAANYFSRASETVLQAGDIDFAFAAWVYPTSTSGFRMIVAKQNSDAATDYWLVAAQTTNLIYFLQNNGGKESTGVSVVSLSGCAANQWSLVVAWHDAAANTINISINNGTVASASTAAITPTTTAATFTIGRRNVADVLAFPGRIGPVAFWKNRTLSAADREALWNGGAGLAYSAFS